MTVRGILFVLSILMLGLGALFQSLVVRSDLALEAAIRS